MDRAHIRPLRGLRDFEGCVEIQRAVWTHSDLDLTPVHQFCIAAETGAILLGAFVGKILAGYVYSFPADLGGTFCQHSHHLAVHPGFRGRGLGKRLKWAQRDEAVRRGYDLITWTYDPMLALNASLNLAALGGLAGAYLDDFYGRTQALLLDRDVPTDRLLVEWRIRTRRVEERKSRPHKNAAGTKIPRAVEQKPGGAYPEIFPSRPDLALDAKTILVEIPRNVSDLRIVPGLIGRWQRAVRKALKRYFSLGYRAEDFIADERCFYVLRKGKDER